MARYSAEEAKSMEYQGADTFRIEKDGGRAKVVFLYTDETSVDGWAHHRLPGPNFYTYVVDCPRKPKDPIDKCPACAAGVELSTRLFVRMYDPDTKKCVVWDKPASFRKDIVGLMHYHKPLYGQLFEITRNGTGLNTRYTMMPVGPSGIDEKQYKELVKQGDEVCDNYVRPIDKFEEIKARSDAAMAEQVTVEGQGSQGGQPQGQAQNAWAQNQPPQGAQQWGAPPAQQWGAPPAQQAQPQQNQSGWGQAPQAAPQQASQTPTTQQGWGQAPQAQQQNQPPWANPQGAWSQPPQN